MSSNMATANKDQTSVPTRVSLEGSFDWGSCELGTASDTITAYLVRSPFLRLNDLRSKENWKLVCVIELDVGTGVAVG